VGSPPLLRRHAANGYRLAALLAVPVALAAAGLTVVACRATSGRRSRSDR